MSNFSHSLVRCFWFFFWMVKYNLDLKKAILSDCSGSPFFIGLNVYLWELTLTLSLGCNEKTNYLKFFCMTNAAEKVH